MHSNFEKKNQKHFSGSCEGKTSRQDSCQSELNPFNHDSGDYGEAWEPLLQGEDELNYPESEPWSYKPWYEVQGSPWFGRLASCFTYGQGGYVVFLGKSEANSKIIYDFINYFNWIDYRTRAVSLKCFSKTGTNFCRFLLIL